MSQIDCLSNETLPKKSLPVSRRLNDKMLPAFEVSYGRLEKECDFAMLAQNWWISGGELLEK